MNIKYAVLHGGIFIPGPGGKGINIGPTLDVRNVSGTSKGLKMTLEDGYLKVEAGGTSTMLPLTSVLHMMPAEG